MQESFDNFLDNWKKEKAEMEVLLANAKTFNKKLKAGQVPGKYFPADKEKVPLSSFSTSQLITKTLPNKLQDLARLPDASYTIKGSIGQGNVSEVPWICVFDRQLTESAQHGYYIVYLFNSRMTGVYLSLNQGWTQYENEYGVKEGKIKIKDNAVRTQQLLRSVEGFDFSPIKLDATNVLGKGYELGNICSKHYSTNNIPGDTELINDLRNLVGVYRELKGLVGDSILDIRKKISEEDFQKEVQKGKKKELSPGAIPKRNKSNSSTSTSWDRDESISKIALEKVGFKCENNPNHATFIAETTGLQFMEAHHLIPMEFQDDFNFSIDVPENIISLCPNCHRAFHNSATNIRRKLVSRFLGERFEKMKEREILITEKELLEYYKV